MPVRSRNIIWMLTRSKVQGLGLSIVGERVWDNINEGLGEEVSLFLRCRLPGSKEEAVVPVQTEAQICMLRAAEPDHQARREQLAESAQRCSNMDNSSCDSGSVKDLTCPADTQQVRKRDQAPTATLQLEKLREQRKTLVEKRDQLRAELSKLADSAVAACSVPPQSQCALPNQSESDEARRQITISSSSSTSTSTSTSSASSSKKKKYKKRRKYNKKDEKRSLAKKKKKRQRTLTSSSSSSSSSSTSTSSSSSSDKKKSKKRRKYNKDKDKKMSFAKRMTTPDQVIHRYGYVLKTYKNCLSVRHALKKHQVEKTTMALTSIIAEVKIASEGENFPVPLYNEGTTLKEFTVKLKRLVESCPELKSKIEEMKRCNKLLPLKWKFR